MTKHVPVNYDIVPSNGVITEAQAHNVWSLTGIWELPGHTAFTAHFQTIWLDAPVQWAAVRYVGGSMVQNGPVTSAQFVSMHYNENGQQVWENVGPLLTQRQQYTVDNLPADVTAQVNSWAGGPMRYLSVKVKGNGKLFQARLEASFIIPDVASLEARIAALEAGGGSGLTLSQVREDFKRRLG
jgi:hypothetical protein